MQTIMSRIYCPDPKNLRFENPVQPGNELNYGYNPMFNLCGYHYDKEMFYLIDFWNIKSDMYYISSYGRIFTTTTGKEMSSLDENGYRRIILRTNDDNNRKSFKIHRLVAMAFIPKEWEDILMYRDIVNHKNLIRCDNYYKNLEWATLSENTQHAFDNNAHGMLEIMSKPPTDSGWGKTRVGDEASMTRVSDEQIHLACLAHIQGKPHGECCIAAGLENNENNRNLLAGVFGGYKRTNIAKQYGITKETKRTKTVIDKSRFEPAVKALLKEGRSIKEITQILPMDDNYDRARMYVSGVRKRMVKNGELEDNRERYQYKDLK